MPGGHAGGSPPRAWGRPCVRSGHGAPIRFTPTCVGTAGALVACGVPSAVHPHVRGDGGRRARRLWGITGSPPRAWGRLCSRRVFYWAGWFTPTCVGTAGAARARPVRPRFTPTCVGTAVEQCPRGGAWSVHPHVRGDGVDLPGLNQPALVHPHVRGDGTFKARNTSWRFGSPPRAWGRPRFALARGHRDRFTPTCVGTAVFVVAIARVSPVHPHVRGDGMDHGKRSWMPYGSPPRAWGRQVTWPILGADARFTPTCVGTATRHRGCPL